MEYDEVLNSFVAGMREAGRSRLSKDVRKLLELDAEKRTQLRDALAEFIPAAVEVTRDDHIQIKRKAKVDLSAARAAFNLLQADAHENGNKLAEDLSETAELEGRHADVSALFAELKAAMASLDKRLSALRQLYQSMKAFARCSIACDLRYLPGKSDDTYVAVPVALVRIGLDEGDDAIFQCNSAALDRMIDCMQEAKQRLARLARTGESTETE